MHPNSRFLIALTALLAVIALPCQADLELELDADTEIEADMPAYGGIAQPLVLLDNGMLVQGDDVASPDGATSGFRLTAGFTPKNLPRLDLGAEVSYQRSDNVPITGEDGSRLHDTTSLGGSLLAGVRVGALGLYAKAGLAEWQGDPIGSDDRAAQRRGTARTQGFGARLQFRQVVSRLEFEQIDAPAMVHLNLMTASIHLPF
ncbi:hypothetical protein [Halomonas saccharevitans]|uniref:Outer membrane protein beta-barrel domain-containing protein n=1 Tax=Halomonas saccharevitans TaxID=416872 RepID=A0A1I6X6K5_9GAMM|nr:hypothetical protein [Halomonas saccharevitans]SFT33551.1 hypothetical protein SAMN04487956_101209 [Halomonas saccharevitans]